MADLNLGLFILRVLDSSLTFLLAASLVFLRKPSAPTEPQAPEGIVSVLAPVRTPRRSAIVFACVAVAVTWLGDAGVVAYRGIVQRWWEPVEPVWKGLEVAVILGFVTWTCIPAIGTFKEGHGHEIWTSSILKLLVLFATLAELANLILLSITFHVFSGPITTPEFPLIPTFLHLSLSLLRLLLLLPLFFILFPPTRYLPPAEPSSERTALLSDSGTPAEGSSAPLLDGSSAGYGTLPAPTGSGPDKFAAGTPAMNGSPPAPTRANGKAKGKAAGGKEGEKEDENLPSTREMVKRLWLLMPYLWPAKIWSLQILAAICIVLLLIGRVVNVLVPITLAQLIDSLARGTSPWWPLARFITLKFVQSGLLENLRSILWMPVMQFSDREMSFLSFDHLMNLSLSFHNKRKLGEVTRILNRGSAVNTLFEVLLYRVVPTILDLTIAVVYILFFFGWDVALVLAGIMAAYALVSVLMTRYRTKMRRRMNEQDTITRGIHTDCLMNYETVKYFVGEDHEGNRYRDSVKKYQVMEYQVWLAANLMSFLQAVIITTGLTLGSFIIIRRITLNEASDTMFIVFITYLGQLTGPLTSLGSTYRALNAMMVDAEKLIALLHEPVDVQDRPGATDLVVSDGVIEFENVSFAYDDRKGMHAVQDVSFTVPKGKHVALVGESGSGKSTLMRLLFRFYDLKEGQGRILIDGKDIRDVTQKSLRRAIGVVPQDSVLFNETIRFNIGYGKFTSTQSEIEAAARAASLHDRILTFPSGYDTKVGERGVKLSGGEKQRVAIARTLLKDPPILLLDEATSALDTATERDIQKALGNLMVGRSSLTIAHRLSTIANADLIIVLKDGHIVERGTHRELLAAHGAFATMWAEHVMSEGGEPRYVPLPETGDATPAEGSRTPAVVAEGYKVEPAVVEDAAKPEPETEEPEPVQEGQTETKKSYAAAAAAPVPSDAPTALVDPPTTSAPVASAPASGPVAFPRSSSDTPVAFPTSTSSSTPASSSNLHVQIPITPGNAQGVTFSPPAQGSPLVHSRPQTPEGSKDPKRKRLSSQNFARMARRISLGGRKASGSEGGGEAKEGKKKEKK